MRAMLLLLRAAVVLVVTLTALAGVLFPAILYGVARLAFPNQAKGSLIVHDGRVVGSRLIGQAFARADYFHPRPSAAGTGYDASASGGSNLGPGNPGLLEAVRRMAAAYRIANDLPDSAWVPVDAVTRSGSGLDPHISVDNARLQAPRVARIRAIEPEIVHALIAGHTEPADFGVLGEPRINVLLLNLALDSLTAYRASTRR